MKITTAGTQKESQILELPAKKNRILHYDVEYDSTKPEQTIRDFVSSVKGMIARYEANKNRIAEIEDELQDIFHYIEISTYKKVPDGYKLVKKEGYAVAWYPVGLSSDGSPNLAYITEQNGYTVIYARSGKIVSVTKTVADSNFFGNGVGVGTVRYERSVFDRWYTSEVTEVYEDNSFVTATYSKYGNGKLTDCQVSDF